MSTLNQIRASKINGAKSKGPVTPEGKARVAQNGTTHGIYSHAVVLHNEDAAAYQSLREDLLNDWGPTSSFEHNLVTDIAEARWRLGRFTTLESAALDFELERMRPEVAATFQHIDEATRTVFAFNALILHNRTFEVLQTAIRHQHRLIDRATAQLLRLRKIRPDQGRDNTPAQTIGNSTTPAITAAVVAKPAPVNNMHSNRGTKPEPAPIPRPTTPETAAQFDNHPPTATPDQCPAPENGRPKAA